MTKDQFVKLVKKECKKVSIKLVIVDQKDVYPEKNKPCGGYFDETNLILTVAKKRPNWFTILIHEYNHLIQWKDKVIISDLFQHSYRDTLPKNNLYTQYHKTGCIAVELDCEKRTVDMIKKLKLPVDIAAYIKGANAYLLFYHAAWEKKQWSKEGKSAYYIPNIIDKMPSDFNTIEYFEMPNKKTLKLFDPCFNTKPIRKLHEKKK